MNLLLLELAQNYFLGSTGQQTSLAFGESEASLRKGLQCALPLVLGGLVLHAQRPGGAAELATAAQQMHGQGVLGNLHKLLAGLPASPATAESALSDRRAVMLHALLGTAYPAAVASISQQAELRPVTVRNLLSLVVAVALGLLGRHAAQQDLGATGLARYLTSQRDAIGQAVAELPNEVGRPLADLLRRPTSITASIVVQASDPADRPGGGPPSPAARPTVGTSAGARAELTPPSSTSTGEAAEPLTPNKSDALPLHQEKSPLATPASVSGPPPASQPVVLVPGRPTGRPVLPAPRPAAYWPWVVLLGLLAVAWLGYFGGRYYNRPGAGQPATAATTTPREAVTRPAATAASHYEAVSDTYYYDPGTPVLVQLPTGNKLRMGVHTAEAQLFYLLTNNRRAPPDPALAGIRLDQVAFRPGTATLTAASQAQLANLAALLQAFPNAQLKVGGFTDNKGAAETSLLLSADRANAVRNTLLARGVTPGRIAARGYGQTHPLFTNATRGGRAQNRRMAILLVSK